MRRFFGLVLAAFSLVALGAERPVEIDPNTRIQGGADVRGSGANAGAGAQTDNRIETDKSALGAPSEERGNVAGPDKSGPEKEKPISERKPQERELEDAAKGASAAPSSPPQQ